MRTCTVASDTAERYVSGTLEEPEQSVFEEHYFACDDCFHDVQALQAARDALVAQPGAGALVKTSRRVPATWMAVAAMLILGVLVWRIPRQGTVPVEDQRPAVTAPSAPVVPQPPTSSQAASGADARLNELAAFTPPPYIALTIRSADASVAAFNEAMTDYNAQRYERAAIELRRVVTANPALAHAWFFLGISELMVGNTDGARVALERTIQANTPPHSDEAYFYLAKAALQAKDVSAASRALRAAIDRDAGPPGEAAHLLSAVEQIQD